MRTDLLGLIAQDFGDITQNPSLPNYACPAYYEMAPRWQICRDARAGTIEIRKKAQYYLPRFEAETPLDWEARISLSFAGDDYGEAVQNLTGMVFDQPIKLKDDVPDALRELLEDVDGEGNHLDVFAHRALDTAIDYGHCVLFTDYPDATGIRTLADQRTAQVRPYVALYEAPDVLSWRTAAVGGRQVLTQIVLRERVADEENTFGVEEQIRIRRIWQDTVEDEQTERTVGLGAIHWDLWKQRKSGAPTGAPDDATGTTEQFEQLDQGDITGIDHIAARVIYGGPKLGMLRSKPMLMGLALSSIEETQVKSDYAAVMHKSNVPTAVFFGREAAPGEPLQMGVGINLAATAKEPLFLEPKGTAIQATRDRLSDIHLQMRRQGATMDDTTHRTFTATEAALYAHERNAKLRRAAGSLQDALEGVLADMAQFLKIATADGGVRSGGSLEVNTEFAGQHIDPQLLTVYVQAYAAQALPLDALLYALEKGHLPEDFSAMDSALQLVAESAAAKAQLASDAGGKSAPSSEAAEGGDPDADGDGGLEGAIGSPTAAAA